LQAENRLYDDFDTNCGPKVASAVVKQLLAQIPMNLPHFVYMNRLIKDYDQIRRVLCFVDWMQVKKRIQELMGMEYLAYLEARQPAIMQIGETGQKKIYWLGCNFTCFNSRIQFRLFSIHEKKLR